MTTVPFTDPTISAPKGAPPKNTPKAILIAKMNENLDRAEEDTGQHKCLVHLKAIVTRYCGDNDTGNLEYWQRQLDFITHKNPTFSAWAGQLSAFARIAFREIEKATPYQPVAEYHTTANTGHLAGRPARRQQLRVY